MKPSKPERTKREEIKTYRDLGLARSLKTRAQRARVERSGVHCVIGGHETERPWIQAPRQRYNEIKREVTRQLLEKARASGLNIAVSVLLQHWQPRIEQETYDRLAAEQQQISRLESAFLQHHDRSPTKQEQARFKESAAPNAARVAGWVERRQTLIDGLLGKMQERQEHNPARYQTIWAEAVGGEIAQQSQLERVNPAEGIAWFRCMNSALSYQLQRQPELAKKLSRALGMTVRALRVSR